MLKSLWLKTQVFDHGSQCLSQEPQCPWSGSLNLRTSGVRIHIAKGNKNKNYIYIKKYIYILPYISLWWTLALPDTPTMDINELMTNLVLSVGTGDCIWVDALPSMCVEHKGGIIYYVWGTTLLHLGIPLMPAGKPLNIKKVTWSPLM